MVGYEGEPVGESTSPSLGIAPKLLFAFAAHGLVAVIGLVTAPIYLHLMGAEAYGLVGFYITLQGWMLALDAGLSPTVARQLARATAGAMEPNEAAGLFKAAGSVFMVVALAVGAAFVVGAGWLGDRWLGASSLPAGEVATCIRLLGLLVAVRWACVLYHAALTGLGKQNILNGIILGGTAARALAAVCILRFVSTSPTAFFAAQLALAIVEAAAYWAALPLARSRAPPAWRRLLHQLPFAGALAVTSAVSIAVTQADKLALSHFIPLRQFGLFSLVAAICGGVVMITPPLTQMMIPRLTFLHAQARRAEFIEIYRLSSSLMSVIAIALTGTIAAHPDLVFLAWTSDRQSAELAKVLSLYALGTGCSIYLLVPYLLQFAHGSVRMHLIGNLVFGALWIPAAVLAAKTYGALGTGITWLVGNALYLAIWTPLVHRRLLSRDERAQVEVSNVRALLLAALVACSLVLPTADASRWTAFVILAAVASIAAGAGVLLFDDLRRYALDTLQRARALGRGAV